MYSTDNGPHRNSWPDGGMTPFRSEKNTNWEGAFRIPLLVRWPGKIEAGSVSNEIVQHHDWFPTFLAMAGEPDVVEKLQEGLPGDRPHLQEPHRRLQPAALPDRQGEGEPAQAASSTSATTATSSALRYDNWKIVFMEQRCHGTLAGVGRAVHAAAAAEDLQPADRSVRVRGRHVEHLLRLVHPPRLHHLRRAGRSPASSPRRSRTSRRSRSRTASPSTMRSRRCIASLQAADAVGRAASAALPPGYSCCG